MAMVSEFVAAINQICSERGIEPEAVYTSLETAVLAAYKREYEKEGDMMVEMDRETGTFRVIAKKEVVKKVEDENIQISLKEAKKIEPGLEVGDTVEIEQEVEDFGRIAAQTAKQVIMQGIRESEKEAVLQEYSDKIGEIFTAMMHRMQGGNAVFEIGKAVAFMPPDEQVSNEFYRVGERYKVLLKAIEDTPRGRTLVISRSDPDFLIGLFAMEVPEIESGVVEVKGCARESGSRSKMSVTSHQSGVDPIGSCVGQRGMRIANVMSELGEEKIDIIEWREDVEEYVQKALSPAQVISVKVEDGVATVKVEEDQLSLAIGKDGQNVRLAAKLTNLKIDIQGPDGNSSRHTKDEADGEDNHETTEDIDENELKKSTKKNSTKKTTAKKSASTKETSIKRKVDEAIEKKLTKAGKSVEEVADWSVEQLMELDGIGKVSAQKIHDALNA
ncbi:transcription termination/antitermination protein NusA [Candidatus Dojkabacteria bacterium]|uniref:Transcription termination/antitermination protein NusA n=1 Tax=Candidatus Dojkabacteria bacterium TaxID=2099670 RepID=A0A955I0S0_9BACT|nr:transcription termination/antitermination protein NusA [Candidatus Dojkabacteria bacterium]